MVKGFTLVEVLLSIALVSIIAGFSVPVFSSMLYRSEVENATSLSVTSLRSASIMARSQKNDSNWGTYFNGSSVTIYSGNKDLIISVKDSGYGIPLDQQDKVFSKNFRAKNIADKKINGTGLGLYVVKLIVNTYKGRMWFESVENKGSTFYFTIPLQGMADKTGEVELAISPTELV